MSSLRSVLIALAAAALVSVPVHATGESARSTTEQPLYYLFSAELLGLPAEAISARFEYRSDYRVLGTDKILLHFGDAATLLVPIPPAPWNLSSHAHTQDLRLLIFADDLLLNVFDRESLLEYNKILQHTHSKKVPSASRNLDASGTANIRLLAGTACTSGPCGGCLAHEDYDCDGVINANDNCVQKFNWGQQDCDNDGYGDVCDGTDGIFQPTGSVETCMTDKDDHGAYKTFEHHVEQRLVDVSSCGSPDRWNHWIREDNDCVGLSDGTCCWGLRHSIGAVGDSEAYWCSEGIRDIDFCH